MAVFTWLATSNEGDANGLYFTASPWRLILTKFRIQNKWHVRGENLASCLAGWKKVLLQYWKNLVFTMVITIHGRNKPTLIIWQLPDSDDMDAGRDEESWPAKNNWDGMNGGKQDIERVRWHIYTAALFSIRLECPVLLVIMILSQAPFHEY